MTTTNTRVRGDIIVQSNDIIRNRKPMSLIGQKVYFEMLRYISTTDTEFHEIVIPLKTIETEWYGGTRTYADIEELVQEINSWAVRRRSVSENGKVTTEWVSIMSKAIHTAGSGELTVRINDDVKPYLLQLKAAFTKMNSRYLKKLSTRGALFYQTICSQEWLSEWQFTPDELKEVLYMDKKKHARVADFEKYVLEPLLKEMNEMTDLDLHPDKQGRGKKTMYILPIVREKREDEPESAPISDVFDMYRTICTKLIPLRGITSKRRELVENIFSKGYTAEDIEQAFRTAQRSDLLSGKEKPWKADFNWIMNEENFVRILEGSFGKPVPLQKKEEPEMPETEETDPQEKEEYISMPEDVREKMATLATLF